MRKCSYFRANECIFALLVAVSRKRLRIFKDFSDVLAFEPNILLIINIRCQFNF